MGGVSERICSRGGHSDVGRLSRVGSGGRKRRKTHLCRSIGNAAVCSNSHMAWHGTLGNEKGLVTPKMEDFVGLGASIKYVRLLPTLNPPSPLTYITESYYYGWT